MQLNRKAEIFEDAEQVRDAELTKHRMPDSFLL